MSGAYYNEFDPETAAWLRELIKQGHIADGEVDERSIEDVHPQDLKGFVQCHFFAGIGVWSYALRRAGWDDSRPIWTGSAPCQPFSAAGKGAAFDDERHLWPAFHHLIKVGRPAIVLGEQVASSAVDAWIDLVHADVEALGYAFGSVPFPSAGVGAPHIRDRNYWVANAGGGRRKAVEQHRTLVRTSKGKSRAGNKSAIAPGDSCTIERLADTQRIGDRAQEEAADHGQSQADRSADRAGRRGVSPGGLADANQHGRGSIAIAGIHNHEYHTKSRSRIERLADDELQQRPHGQSGISAVDAAPGRQQSAAAVAGLRSDLWPGPTNGFWSDADWLGCRDGKFRPVEPGTFPLVNGASARVVRLRGYGNAINAEAAQAWIETVMECTS